MVKDDKLSAVLADFARTMLTDFPKQRILDELVRRIVDILPITSAGVTWISVSDAPPYVAASHDAALRYEQLQSQIGEGPCVSAYETGEAVIVADLAIETRFPRFAPAACEAGLGAVFTFPLRHDTERFGALDLYRDRPGDLDPDDIVAAQTLADVAAGYILNAHSRDAARVAADGFQRTSLHDPLTGLPNCLLFHERLVHATLRARRSHTQTAILFADIDRFKSVNDTFGHHAGDEPLVEIARRLSALLRPSDTLVRFAGDEFVIVCEDIHDPSDAKTLVERIHAAFAQPFDISGHPLSITASVGVAYAGPGDDVTNQLLIEADLQMYRVKRSRSQHSHLSNSADNTDDGDGDERRLEIDLRSALADDRLDVVYQPIVDVSSQRTVGVEALLRWTHPTRGDIAPSTIIAIAERSDVIDDIGTWVLRRACTDHRVWTHHHPARRLDLAVNVSCRQITGPSMVGSVTNVLADTGMDPASLVLEIAETVLLDSASDSIAVLTDLAELGIRLSLDDFGTGYSALHYLDRLPFNILKIDQHFIARLTTVDADNAIVDGITTIAHRLGLAIVAEGVETLIQHNHVVGVGCDYAQGYFYAHPSKLGAVAWPQPSRSRTPFAGTVTTSPTPITSLLTNQLLKTR